MYNENSSNSIQIIRKYQLPRNPKLLCDAGNVKVRGTIPPYIGRDLCDDVIQVRQLSEKWEGKYPSYENTCGGGDPNQSYTCRVPVAGFSHPHVIYLDDYTYNLHIDLPYY